MQNQPVHPPRARALAIAAVLLLAAPALGACAAGASPDPSAPCNGADEQSRPGFYPDLEAMLPKAVDGQALSDVRSGRYCSANTLGTLKTKAGIAELEFAGGALPDRSAPTGIGLVVYRARGLTLDALADAQAQGAATTTGATGTTARRVTIAGRSGIRIGVTVESGPELLFFWPAGPPGTFEGVTGIGTTDQRVAAAVAAFGPATPASPAAASERETGVPATH
jgi:hypothetical protein